MGYGTLKKIGKIVSLRARIVLTTAVVCVVALVVQGSLLVWLSSATFSEKVAEDLEYFMKSSHTQLGDKMRFVENTVLNLRNDPSMQSFFSGTYDAQKIEKQFSFCADLTAEQNLVNSYVPFVTDVYVFNHYGDYLSEYYHVNSMTITEKLSADRAAWKVYQESENMIDVIGGPEENTIYLSVRLYDDALNQQGGCVLQISPNALELLQEDIDKYQGAAWLLFNSSGQLLKSYGFQPEENDLKQLWTDTEFFVHDATVSGNVYITLPDHLSFGLKSIILIPKTQLYSNLSVLVTSLILIILLLIPAMLLLAMYSSIKVSEPLKMVTSKIRQVSTGDFSAKLEHFGIQEFDAISETFNVMTEQIQTLITEVYENQLLATQSQIKYLQAQINPHFLYNVLSQIALQAKLDGSEETYQMVFALSKLLQGRIFRSGEIKICLREEMELVGFYLYLQNMRFSDKISYEIDCSEDVQDLLIPRLCIEPLVENAIQHGLEPKETPGTVWVSVKCDREHLNIEVRDDGVGFTTKPENAQDQKNHAHVGIENIRQMLHNLYGDTCRMCAESEQGTGTRVRMTLPVERRDAQ